MTEKQTIQFDLDKLNNIAHTGVRRAVLFMGLGLNAAHREDFNDYELRKLPMMPGQTSIPMDFFPSELPIERVRVFKEEFATWITACGMREILEHYALFLDQMNDCALTLYAARGKLGDIEPSKAQDDFTQRYGIPRKLKTLRERFGFGPQDEDSINSLYQARNCLTHDLGVVLQKRVDQSGMFKVSWRSFRVFGEGEETGKRVAWADMLGKPTTEPMNIYGSVEKIEKSYPVNKKMVLLQQDLWEICFFFNAVAIPSGLKSFKEFCEREGVRIEVSK